ncbi:MAG TPA: sugar phosphate nucleotidyltransferase [Nitrospira sp.]|nr:sugar phosphate nucleotidyltransferase [Nitrospira sp.]
MTTMTNGTTMPSRIWSIVLGGGEGGCIREFIQRWLGHPRPKQYCTFFGERSLFQHTLDRASALSRQEHILALVAREHGQEAWAQLEGREAGTVLLQPKNRDSAAGIYLSLTYLRAKDPDATVVIYPSDHFVYPETGFLMSVHRALCTLEWLPGRFVVLGVPPDRLELDYGWIVPGAKIDGFERYRIHSVRAFTARPTLAEADAALAGGALWNTSVMAAKAETLWRMGYECFPDLMPGFERLGRSIGTSKEAQILDEIYHDIPAHDLSSELLQRVPERAAVVEMSGVLWSDWGKPARIVDSLRRIGRDPAFPLNCLAGPHGRSSYAGQPAGSS